MKIPTMLYTDAQLRRREPRENGAALTADLNLSRIFAAMAQGDAFIGQVAKETLLCAEHLSAETIRFRQDVLKDFLRNPSVCGSLYGALSAGIIRYDAYVKQSMPSFSSFITVSAVTRDRIVLFRILFDCARDVRAVMESEQNHCNSDGVRACFAAFEDFFSAGFMSDALEILNEIEACCENPYARVTAGLGLGLKGDRYALLSIADDKARKNSKDSEIILGSVNIQTQAARLRDAALAQISHVLKQVNDATLACLKSLRFEIGFYMGGMNLHQKLEGIGVPVCYPNPEPAGSRSVRFDGLVDIGLAIENARMPVGNTFQFDDCRLLIVTGANQGGKSTFLRSLGCAELMMQCGLFVAANQYSAAPSTALCTHFCRSESMKPDEGRLDEELRRIEGIIGQINRDSLVLMNESFSTTSEHEASAIAAEMLQAFYDLGIRAVYVTHFHEFAQVMQGKRLDGINFLTAQRNTDGTRPYRLAVSPPARTSFALDIYREVFGDGI